MRCLNAAACGMENVSLPSRESSEDCPAPGFTLGFEECENVVLLDRPLDVSDDGSRSVVHELDADLYDTTSGAGSAEDLGDLLNAACLISHAHLFSARASHLCELDGYFLGLHADDSWMVASCVDVCDWNM